MEAPYLLAALPQLDDEIFMHAVILVTEHSASGAFGLILNKALVDDEEGPALMRAEIKDQEGNTLFEFNEDLYDGGPLEDEAIFALHEIAELGNPETSIGESLFLSQDPNLFQKLFENTDDKSKRRFFLGCSSWEAGQLDSELRTGSWLPVSFHRSFIFEEPGENKSLWSDDFWKRVLEHGGANPLTLIGQGPSDVGSN